MVNCTQCGEPLYIGEWPFCPHGSLRGDNAQRFDPVVYFENSDGHRLFPGRSAEQPPSGYIRKELCTIAAVRAFESSENRRLFQEHHDSQMNEQLQYDYYRKGRVEQIRHDLPQLSGTARKAAEALISRYEARSYSSNAARFDAGFNIECFSRDSSNRLEWNDRDTVGRRGRK